VEHGGRLCTLVPTHEDRLPLLLALLPTATAAAAAAASIGPCSAGLASAVPPSQSPVAAAKAFFRAAIDLELQAAATEAGSHRTDTR
jgi:hypothetical protein